LPTPAKTSREALVGIARGLVESAGADALTVSAVAHEAGVKGPSLYKHFADRGELLKAVEMEVLGELEQVLRERMKGRTVRQRLKAMAAAYRQFASDNPRHYELLYSRNAFADPDIAAACYAAARPLFEELGRAGVPEKGILPLARTLTAFLHGFVSMEIANAFRLGGDIDEAFAEGIETILRGIGR
jgi:AcrR family transcriptional regulator